LCYNEVNKKGADTMILGQPIWKFIVDVYIVWILVYFLLKFLINNKKIFSISLSVLFVYIIYYLTNLGDILASSTLLLYVVEWVPIVIIIVMAPDIRRALEIVWKNEQVREDFEMGSERTKQHIIDAVMVLASQQIGALITIEKHNTLDQYAERAIMMNSDVSKEVLVNIFTPNTPLHDGAVIIRGDQILCAGAYFVLSDNQNYDKTMGSRHRAGLGISEITDSLTILVSEETGNISVAIEGILLKMNDREKLLEYLNMFMK
jgi:diadenylate cyclase